MRLPKKGFRCADQSAREAIETARALREDGDMPKALRVALEVSSQASEYPAAYIHAVIMQAQQIEPHQTDRIGHISRRVGAT